MTHQTGNFLVPQHSGEPETKPRKIRCRQCGKNAFENLVICPYCGRELYAAAPRWLMWGAPVVLVLLFGIVVTTWGQTNPITWTASQVSNSRTLLTDIVRRIEPRLVSGNNPTAAEAAIVAQSPDQVANNAAVPADVAAGSSTGSVTEGDSVQVIEIAPETATGSATEPAGASQPLVTEAETATQVPTATSAASLSTNTLEPTPTTGPTATDLATNTAIATATEAATATDSPTRAASVAQLLTTPTSASGNGSVNSAGVGNSATDAPTATERATATATETPAPTATPTEAPTEAPTATSPPQQLTYEIQAGDTLLAIANQFGITVDELMTANSLSQADVLALRPGQELLIPQNGGTGASNSGASQPQTYTVQSGDTPSSIANRFGVSVDALLTVNGLTAEDATRLRTGQVLIIPDSTSSRSSQSDTASADRSTNTTGAAGAASATGTPATVTPATVTNTSTNSANSGQNEPFRLSAPTLRTPQDEQALQCSQQNSLVWNPTSSITLDDSYILHLGYVDSLDGSGAEVVQWVLAQQSDATRTFWEMDSDYCSLAPQELGRQWRWYVEVVDSSGTTVSPPSEIWAFTWN